MVLNDKQKEELKVEAKSLLSSFAKSLEKVKFEISSQKNDHSGYRDKSSIKSDSNFKKLMFDNAPKSNNNYIIAERKKW